MNREEQQRLEQEYRAGRIGRDAMMRRLGKAGFSLAGALALVGALASAAQAGVEAQHNETLIRL